MTTIRDLAAPAIDGELQQPDEQQSKARRNSWLVATLCASAMAVTLMNLLASVYLYRAGSQIRAVGRKLAELPEFEKRIKERLDLVNTGVQSRFDILNRDFQGRLATISFDIGQLQRASAAIGAGQQAAFDAGGSAGVDAESTLSISEQDPAESEPVSPQGDGALARKQAGPPPTIDPSYKRIEQADGKVTYRKVH